MSSRKLTLFASESSPWHEVAKIFGPAKPLLLRVGDRQPVQQTLVVPQRQSLRLVNRPSCSSFLTSYSRYNDSTNTVPHIIVSHITKTKRALLVVEYPHVLFTELPSRSVLGNRGSGVGGSRKWRP